MKVLLSLCGVAGIACCWGLSGVVVSDDQISPDAPMSKEIYESKIDIETPAEKIVRTTGALLPSEASSAVKDRKTLAAKPGNVNWHENYAAACKAGRDSGKPILLFQLMGRLDEVFC